MASSDRNTAEYSSPSGVPSDDFSVPTEPIWRFSIDQYHEMIRSGILTEDDPVELLEGWLVAKMTKTPAHRITTLLVRKALEHIMPDGWYVDTQEPITTKNSEPEPDVEVIRGDTRTYRNRHPGPQEVSLVVEVADASLKRDRGSKMRVYAGAGIQVYWIVNLPEKQVEVFSEPRPDQLEYKQKAIYGSLEAVPVVIAGETIGSIPVSEILP